MPELPEVETIKRILEPQLVSRTVTHLTLNRPDIVERPTPEVFAATVTGAIITSMGRQGKYLSVLLQNGGRIVLHLLLGGIIVAIDIWSKKRRRAIKCRSSSPD